MKKVVSTFLLFFTFLFSIGFSQTNIEFTKENFKTTKDLKKIYKKYVRKGHKYYYTDDKVYPVALEYYLLALQKHENSALLNYLIADCYLHTFEKYKALQYIERAIELNPAVAENIDFVMGWALHHKFQFKEAIVHYEKFLNYSRGKLSKDSVLMTEKHILECTNGIELIKSEDYEVINVGGIINTKYSEYVPIITVDEKYLVFTARRPKEKKNRKKKIDLIHYYYRYNEDIFRSNHIDTSWTTPIKYGTTINKGKRHDACVSLSLDGQTIFTYSGENGGDLYYEKIENGIWSKPIKMEGVINTSHRESHISTNYDMNSAYLITDRPGGYGGTDIWLVTKNEQGVWDKMENLGPTINTPYNEDGVFIHPDGKTLYFSSEGHNSMGGFDIFETTFDDSSHTWSRPLNMGKPINSPDDDIFFVLTADGKNAYLSSVKETGYGMQDIYCIRPFEKKAFKDFHLVIFKGIVIDKVTKERLNAKVEITDNETGKVLFSSNVDAQLGFVISLPAGKNYGIAVEKDGYLFHSENFNLERKAKYREIEKIIELEKIQKGSKIILRNVFFDFDKSDLKDESVFELNRLLKLLEKYPEINLQLEGHTDSHGSDEYNISLSQRRIDSVKDYLVKNGLNSNRIKNTIGFGEAKPIDTNETDEGRANNRRVEFTIVD